MVRAMCVVQLKDIERSMHLMLGLNEAIDELLMSNIAHWYGHVLRWENGPVPKRALYFGVEIHRKKGRMKRTWKKQAEDESMKVGLITEDTLCRSKMMDCWC